MIPDFKLIPVEKKTQKRADVQITIEDMLFQELSDEKYPEELIINKSNLIYQHVYDSYQEAGKKYLLIIKITKLLSNY